MKKQAFYTILFFVLILLAPYACQQQATQPQKQALDFPPESPIVKEDGSVPPAHRANLAASKVDTGCITCNSQNRYGPTLKPNSKLSASMLMEKLTPYLKDLEPAQKEELLKELESHIMWWMVRTVLIEAGNNNFGALVLKDRYWTDEEGNKHPLTVFRAAFTPDPRAQQSCYRSLLEKGRVRHVINLYDGEMYMDDLVAAERSAAAEFGASYVRPIELDYGHWRGIIREHPEPGPEREGATKNVARLINEQILMPGGNPPRGNILIHCGGGMHRTGMIMGILQKVINGAPMAEIEKNYRYHVAYRDENRPGGFEQGNLDFIAEFKAEYLLAH
jgi:hypothetical protein